jgi:hypothetical protein
MIDDAGHDRIEELLAGYALRALSGEDTEEADRLLAEHVPTCARCRATLQDFLALEGDLGLAAPAATPPDLLLPRLRQEVATRRQHPRRSVMAWGAMFAAAVVVGLFSWNTIALNGRVARFENRERRIAGAFQVVSDPASKTVNVSPRRAPNATRLIAAYVPGREEMSILGTGVPDPQTGEVYRIWLLEHDGGNVLAGEFIPESGLVAFLFTTDLTGYRAMLITEEEGPSEGAPNGPIRWATEL